MSGFYYCDKEDKVNVLNLLKMFDSKLMNMKALEKFKGLYNENQANLTNVEVLIEQQQEEQMRKMLEEFK